MTNEQLYGVGRSITGTSYAHSVRHDEPTTNFDEVLGILKGAEPVNPSLRKHFEDNQTLNSGLIGLTENQEEVTGNSPHLCGKYDNLRYGNPRGLAVNLSV
ncbi:hypothetical protein HY448_02425 [Candidatus Pacearchaeota archaeon]|nr:hypothetical protein [Candidatus Pacearchaeota archaeon]